MEVTTKDYKVNKYFFIRCTTRIYNGIKKFSVEVISLGLPFELPIESIEGITESSEANRVFKEYLAKYKEDSSFLKG